MVYLNGLVDRPLSPELNEGVCGIVGQSRMIQSLASIRG